ncbi:MAG TPA: Ig-like domain-containing protein, partial [Verrucomicrobiota bacterium]|nr:Ig-like domain-containing protein [Verrucomicrobiota bacterium]
GVNSDDGFRVTAGRDPANPANVLLGVFEGGRGAADTLFYVQVEQDGIYPVRLIWYEGGGDANLEFFSVRQPTPDDPIQRLPINSRAEANALRSYARAAVPQAPAASVYPLAGAVNVPASTPVRAALIPRTAEANPGSVQLAVNGTPAVITTSAGQAGLVVEHVRDTLWPSGAPVTAVLSYADTGGNQATVTWQFTVENYESLPVIPAGFAAAPGLVNTSSSGFIVDMYQMDDGTGLPLARTGFADANSPEAAEHQINRRFLDPGTGQPWPNFAALGDNPDGTHNVELVNWNQQFGNAGDFNAGNGFEDDIVPGIFEPGDNAFNNWIVAEAIAWVELKKGRHRLGVNSDDGFRVSTGANPGDAVGIQLGVFPTGRGAGNTFFDFIVEADGIYPLRLLWWEGTGGASVEFKSQDLVTLAQTLVNDRTRADGLRAYRLLTGPAPARIAAVSPVPGNTDVLPNDPVSVTFEDLGAAPAQLFINGEDVATTRSTAGNLTTLTFQPATPFQPGSTVQARAVRGGSASTWSFTIRNAPTVAITSPANGTVIATSPANVTVTATASIVGATITLVEFFDGGGAKLGEDATAPYELALNGLEGGRYT